MSRSRMGTEWDGYKTERDRIRATEIARVYGLPVDSYILLTLEVPWSHIGIFSMQIDDFAQSIADGIWFDSEFDAYAQQLLLNTQTKSI